MPNVNLRGIYTCIYAYNTIEHCNCVYSLCLVGLEPADIRNAQIEFAKFDMEGDGICD